MTEQPSPPPRRLSKSRIALFEQCAKRLWLSVHRPELAQESDGTKRVFRVGHEVGAAACALYPDGVEIDGSRGMAHAAALTAAAMRRDPAVPLFEATFIYADVAVRVDLLLPDGNGWQVIEVKSTTGVKAYQRADLATQLWVLRGCGVTVTHAAVRVIDRTFVLRSAGDYEGLFIDEPADDDVAARIEDRGAVISEAIDVLAGSEPMIGPGAQCTAPFRCSFESHCGRNALPPPEWPVAMLPGVRGKALARTLSEQGLDDLLAVEPEAITVPLLQRIHAATVTGIPWHDVAGVRRDTQDWSYPRTFLDFESIAFAVPRWLGTSPYSQVPFQFSAHIDRGTGDLEHAAFLSLDGCDPRPDCAQALAALPDTGAVIAWNAPFECSCLMQLAKIVPDHAAALRSIADRLVDLLPVARRHYYHRDMRGSWSIKAVLPTLAPKLDYAKLDGARSGVEAQDAYLEAIDRATTPDRRAQLQTGLFRYCRQDTLAMVVALDRLCANPVYHGLGFTIDD